MWFSAHHHPVQSKLRRFHPSTSLCNCVCGKFLIHYIDSHLLQNFHKYHFPLSSWPYSCFFYIYIYAFSRRFIQSDVTVHLGYTVFYQYVCSLGIEPTTFCAANAMPLLTTELQEYFVVLWVVHWLLWCNHSRDHPDLNPKYQTMFDMIGGGPRFVCDQIRRGKSWSVNNLTLPYNAPNIGTDWCLDRLFSPILGRDKST